MVKVANQCTVHLRENELFINCVPLRKMTLLPAFMNTLCMVSQFTLSLDLIFTKSCGLNKRTFLCSDSTSQEQALQSESAQSVPNFLFQISTNKTFINLLDFNIFELLF